MFQSGYTIMPRKNRVLVPYPPEVIAAVDQIVRDGEIKRTTFLVELAKREVKRQKMLRLLNQPSPIWNPDEHPEIDDAGEWVRTMRAEWDARVEKPQGPEKD
jgi:hypothetical protein